MATQVRDASRGLPACHAFGCRLLHEGLAWQQQPAATECYLICSKIAMHAYFPCRA